jgi:hypothetical protein
MQLAYIGSWDRQAVYDPRFLLSNQLTAFHEILCERCVIKDHPGIIFLA